MPGAPGVGAAACRALEQARSTQRYQPVVVEDEAQLTQEVVRLASKYGRYGYRMITGLLRGDGWTVNHKRVERIWRAEGLKVPPNSPNACRLWLNDGSAPAYARNIPTMSGATTL